MLSSRLEVGELGDSLEISSADSHDSRQPVDVLDISPEGDAEASRIEAAQQASEGEQSESDPSKASQGSKANTRPAETSQGELSDSELQAVTELKMRDAEVRAHEAAHKAVGGSYASSASYTYQTGPDGNQYAVGGEVGIDTSKGSTPEETIAKARQIRAAALAPAQPSSQDIKVAAAAMQMENAARAEKAVEKDEESEEGISLLVKA